VYWHPELKVLLIVYVDDFKMSGPEASMAKAWEKLRKGLVIEDPSPAGKFLGCNNVIIRHTVEEPFNCLSLVGEGGTTTTTTGGATGKGESRVEGTGVEHTGVKTKVVNMVKYDQKDFLVQCVSHYIELTGKTPDTLKRVETPFIDITTAKALEEDDHNRHKGALAPVASKVLMKILYAARVGRFDLLRPVCWLATKVTKWSTTCDVALHRLVCYINSTLDVACYGWVGDR